MNNLSGRDGKFIQRSKKLIDEISWNDELSENEIWTEVVSSKSLLTWNRLDLAFKLLFLDLIEKNKPLALAYYEKDIYVMTRGLFKEPGNIHKSNFESFVAVFNSLRRGIQTKGYDPEKSVIPVSISNTITNGAHRTAISIYRDIDVTIAYMKTKEMVADYRLYYNSNIKPQIIEDGVIKFLEYSRNTYVAFLWPSGFEHHESSRLEFDRVVYEKELQIDRRTGLNLLIELYKHMEWIGSEFDGFKGVYKKYLECFSRNKPTRIVVFQEDSLNEVQKIKERVRNINGIGFSSIHITDTPDEALQIGQLLFNENGINFLKNADAYRFLKFRTELYEFKKVLEGIGVSKRDIVIDGSGVLALYGIRENMDLDCLTSVNHVKLNSHDEVLEHHGVEKEELIYNPRFHFVYDGLKFISLKQIAHLKKSRAEKKDKIDVKLINAYLENRGFDFYILRLKQFMNFILVKSKLVLIKRVKSILVALGIFNTINNFIQGGE